MAIFNRLTIVFTLGTSVLLGLGIRASLKSPLFAIQQIEVDQLGQVPALNESEVVAVSGLEIGGQSLFGVDLARVERHLLQEDWIRSVQLEKRFPQTVVIRPTYREPVAGFLRADGKISYVDRDGAVFSVVRRGDFRDLPLISGCERADREPILRALALVRRWGELGLDSSVLLSTVTPLADGDLSLAVSYGAGRTQVVVGFEDAFELETQLKHIQGVFDYLSKSHLAVRGVWANSGKKIVVKSGLGS